MLVYQSGNFYRFFFTFPSRARSSSLHSLKSHRLDRIISNSRSRVYCSLLTRCFGSVVRCFSYAGAREQYLVVGVPLMWYVFNDPRSFGPRNHDTWRFWVKKAAVVQTYCKALWRLFKGHWWLISLEWTHIIPRGWWSLTMFDSGT